MLGSALRSEPSLHAVRPDAGMLPDDPEARVLLQRAQGAIQKWPEGFAGFRARLSVTVDGCERSGWALVGPRGCLEVDLADGDLRDWARAVLDEIAAERTPRFFKDGDGRFPIAFDAAAPDDSLGRRLLVQRGGHGLPAIAYRIDERARLRQRDVWEAGEGRVHTYEAFARTTPGRLLPARRSTVVYDAGGVVRTELIEETHRRVCHTWLPAGRRVQVRHLDATSLRCAHLDDHTLL
jgi:hypothetical protein